MDTLTFSHPIGARVIVDSISKAKGTVVGHTELIGWPLVRVQFDAPIGVGTVYETGNYHPSVVLVQPCIVVTFSGWHDAVFSGTHKEVEAELKRVKKAKETALELQFPEYYKLIKSRHSNLNYHKWWKIESEKQKFRKEMSTNSEWQAFDLKINIQAFGG